MEFLQWLQSIGQSLMTLTSNIGDFFSYIFSIFQTMFYTLSTTLTGVFELLTEIFTHNF